MYNMCLIWFSVLLKMGKIGYLSLFFLSDKSSIYDHEKIVFIRSLMTMSSASLRCHFTVNLQWIKEHKEAVSKR